MKHIAFLLILLSGCAGEVTQTEACARWVSCIDARDEQLGIETDNLRFEASGSCWSGAEGAALCDAACEDGLVWMQEAYADLPEACL